MNKKQRFYGAALLCCLLHCMPVAGHTGVAQAAASGDDDGTKRYSQWMVESEMRRVAHPYNLDASPTKPRWAYSLSIELEGMFDTYLAYRDEAVGDYIKEYPATMINSDGSIERYNYSDFNLDNVRPGHFLLRFYNEYPAEKEWTALNTLYDQLLNQPRTDEGIWWHKEIYKQQVWLDGIFMGLPYYVLAAPQLHPEKVNEIYGDAVDQIVKTERRTYDAATGLWKHAWDETASQIWADPTTGLSQHTWGRALGWFAMAMLEVLEALPSDYERRAEVLPLFQKVMAAVVRYQDAESGVWPDVLDVDRASHPENYLEATASAMFTYCMLKGARLGFLDAQYKQLGIQAYRDVVREFIADDTDNPGCISLIRCCKVSGLGNWNTSGTMMRDGSFEYYMSEPIVENDAKGIGPFIWASLEMERMGYTADDFPADSSGQGDAEAGTTVYTVGEGDTFQSGQTIQLGQITLTYGEAGGPDFQTALEDPIDKVFRYYSPGNGVNGNKDGGTFYVFRPQHDGELTVAVRQNQAKLLYVEEDGIALPSFNGIGQDETYAGTYTFGVKAGSSYKLYCSGSKLGFYGFRYEWNDASGIRPAAITRRQASSRIYSLSGRLLPKPQKGINIIGGRKVMAR